MPFDIGEPQFKKPRAKRGLKLIETLINGPERAAVFRLLIDAVRGFSNTYWGTTDPGENITDILIAATLMVGQGEGRPLTAGDVSNISGLNRITVTRRLKAMQASDMAVMEQRGRRKVYGLANPNRREAFEQLNRLLQQFAAVFAELSKMSGQFGHIKDGNR